MRKLMDTRGGGRTLLGATSLTALLLIGGLTLGLGSGPMVGSVEAAAATYPAGAIDAPAEGAQVSGGVSVSGWAIDAASTTDSGVDRVDVYVDGTLRGQALYGRARPDIGAGYGARFSPSGFLFLLDTSLVGGGAHTVEARAHSSVAGTTASLTRHIQVAGPPASPTPTPNPAATATPVPTIQPTPTRPPATPASFPKQFGVNAHLLWGTTDQMTLDVERARAAGLHAVRLDVGWDKLEPTTKGSYDQSYLAQMDGALDALTSRGLQPLLVVINTPAWARGNAGTTATPPTRVEDYADTLGFLAARYSSRAGLAFEVWNEPNQVAFWNTPAGPDALTYARMLKAAYTSIKAAAPSATVVGGSIAFNDQSYLQSLYAFGGIAGYYDALSLHPYCADQPPDVTGDGYRSFIQAVQQTLQTMATYGESGKPVWITEMGWSTDTTSEGLRVAYERRALELVRGWPQVAMYMAYLEDQVPGEPSIGLISTLGNPSPSWLAYGLAAAGTTGASPAGVIDSPQDWTTTSTDVQVSGWAIDQAAASGPGVDRVQVYVDGVYRGDATYGLSRTDLAAQYGPTFLKSGYLYQLAVAGLAPGSHIVEVRAHSSSGASASYLRGLKVIAVPTYPAGSLDWPADNLSVSGSVAVNGWALDMGAPSGSGVDRVQVFIDGVYAADATYGLARGDIAAGYGARFSGSGFAGQVSLAGLAPGPHVIEARARSVVTGATASYRRTVVVGSS